MHKCHPLILKAIVLFLCLITMEATASASRSEFLDTITLFRKDTIIKFIFPDTISTIDTTQKEDALLKYLQRQSEKGRIQKLLHDLLVKSDSAGSQIKDRSTNLYHSFLTKKTIQSIRYIQLSPFGTSVHNTAMTPSNWIEKSGNKLSIKTSKNIIRHQLLFQEGEQVSAFEIEESERRLRNLGFIRDALIVVQQSEDNPENIDIQVITQDVFPHAFNVNVFSSKPTLGIYSRNIAGLGVGYSQNITMKKPSDSEFGFNESVKISDIGGSHVDLDLIKYHMFERNYIKMEANREFFSSNMKYGGGFNINRVYSSMQISEIPQIEIDTTLSYKYSEFWVGRSFSLSKQEDLIRKNIYILYEQAHTRFYKPDEPGNMVFGYNKYKFFSIGYSQRGYFKNNLIYSFGRTEDVPKGMLLLLTGGINENEHYKRHYLSASFSNGLALTYNRGYLYYSIDAESYLRQSKFENAAITFKAGYISPLKKRGNYYFRHFFEFYNIYGFNRFENEFLYLSEKLNGIKGINALEIKGKEKLLLKMENTAFTPIEKLGFKLVAFTFAEAGICPSPQQTWINSRVYTSIGGGIRIHNDKLAFNTIQIRFAFLPFGSGNGNHQWSFASPPDKKFNDFYPRPLKLYEFK